MAKPVSGTCNLACEYCYYLAKPAQLYGHQHRPVMSQSLLEDYTRQYLEASPDQRLFAWQGGEPLLAGKEFFAQAVDIQRQAAPGKDVSNVIQTNGTLLDDEWCDFFAANHFLVGVSLDGPPQWHDRFRRDRSGGPTFDRAWAGLELLKKHGVETNVLVTLNGVNAPHGGDIYRYFVNRGVRYLQFIPILERIADGQIASYSCSPEQFGKFLLDVFDVWRSRDVGRVSERFIDGVLYWLIHHQAIQCCYASQCANAFVLEWNGDLYACDHFVYEKWRLGNIAERPLKDLLLDPMLETFASLKTSLPDACRDCEFLAMCNGGCPKHHSPPGTDRARLNYFCQGYKMFFREALPELRRIADGISRGQHAQFTGEPKRPVQTVAPSGRGLHGQPGRNDPCPCSSGLKYKNCCGRGR